MEALASLGYETAGKIPAALLSWILHFNTNNNSNHIHQLVSINSDATTSEGGILHFHCWSCYTKFTLRVLESGNRSNKYICSVGPVHHLHTYIASDKLIEQSNTEIEIRCCLCEYYAILSYQSPPIPEDIMNAFVMSLKSRKSAINNLKSLRNLLDEASRGGSREVSYTTKIINIRQNEHVM
jgi:hypothetical protein